MIKLNGKVFAKNPAEAKQLQADGQAVVGRYRRYTRSVLLTDLDGQRVAVINQEAVLCHATKIEGGYWYSYATVDCIGEWPSYTQERDELEAALRGDAVAA